MLRLSESRALCALAGLALLTATAHGADRAEPTSRSAAVKALAELPRIALPEVNVDRRLAEDAANTAPGPLRYAIPNDMSVTPDSAGTWAFSGVGPTLAPLFQEQNR